MARSSYIYVVFATYETANDSVIGVFTVKHEMSRFIKSMNMDHADFYVRRYRDGQPNVPPTAVEDP